MPLKLQKKNECPRKNDRKWKHTVYCTATVCQNSQSNVRVYDIIHIHIIDEIEKIENRPLGQFIWTKKALHRKIEFSTPMGTLAERASALCCEISSVAQFGLIQETSTKGM